MLSSLRIRFRGLSSQRKPVRFPCGAKRRVLVRHHSLEGENLMRLKLVALGLMFATAPIVPQRAFADKPDKDFKKAQKHDEKEINDQDKAYRQWLKVQGKEDKEWAKASEKERKEYYKWLKKNNK